MNRLRFPILLLCTIMVSLTVLADDYTNYLTTARGFTEVTTTEGITGNANDYYILVPAETHDYIVGIGRYENKPGWASEDSKALRYKSAATDPVLDLTNFFTIEKSGSYIGLRNVVYSADMFQTHDNAGYMYINTFTDKNLDDWSYLTPTYQNGYWLFESGKYPISSGNWASGFLGPWNKTVAAGEPMALNRKNTAGDEAGHYRLFRISKSDLKTQQCQALFNASASNPLNATWLITNPSFETGDETGWTLIGKDPNGNDEFKTRDYGMSNKDGMYLMNAFQWWAKYLGVTQTVDLPSGEYTLSGVVATWANRIVYFTGNDVTVNTTGTDDATGIPVSLNVNIGMNSKLAISAGSTAEWWNTGHEGETQTFFKLDNVQLTCKGLYLNGAAKPLPNDETTVLEADTWYYYEVNYKTEYWLIGNLSNIVYSTDGLAWPNEATTADVTREMLFDKGRVYFKTTRSDATLKVVAKREIIESTSSFKACALNVDGLPESITIVLVPVTLNENGPQSDGTKKISTYLGNKAYDLMAFSEDFNFHSELTSQLPTSYYHWGTHQGKITVTSRDTDGLEFACKTSKVTWNNESITRYTSKSSTDGNQYIEKGFRHYDVTFDGQIIDVYITHMDAGDNSDAITSRGKQWKQLTEAINAVDEDNHRETPRPKIVMGDTNCRWTRDAVKANFLDQLSSNFTASDVWVEFYRNGIYPTTDMGDLTDESDPTNYSNYEIVDKIIYINPTAANTLQLVPQSFKIEQDYIYDTIDHDGNTDALGDHKPVVVEFKYIKSGDVIPLTLALGNDATDNGEAIANMSGATANVTLSGRTLYKDNEWNTICLPFNVTLAGSPLADATAKTLTGGSITPRATVDHVDLTFGEDVSSLTAGKPYIIKWASGDHITNPVFSGVTITSPTPQTLSFDGGNVKFIGYYDAFGITSANSDIYYLTTGSELTYTAIDRTLKACRAYFQFTPPSGSSAKAFTFSIDFGDGETAITSPSRSTVNEGSIYNLAGQRMNEGQLEKGVYIINGKKVLIK